METKVTSITIKGPYKFLEVETHDCYVTPEGVELYVGQPFRVSYAPGEDLTEAPWEVQKVAQTVWTQEIIEAYEDFEKQAAS